MHAFGEWEEIEVTGENPRTHRKATGPTRDLHAVRGSTAFIDAMKSLYSDYLEAVVTPRSLFFYQ